MIGRVAAACLRILGAVSRTLPPRWASALGRALGWIWYRVLPVRRAVARANVARALGAELDTAGREALVRSMYGHLGQAFVELLRLAVTPPEAVLRDLDVRGRTHLDAALAAGRGALVLTAHLGNWEVLVRVGDLAGRPLTVITKRFRAPWAERAWRGLRVGGARLLAADGAGRAVVRALEAGELVGYVLDQHVPPARAVWVPFFGTPAATSPDLVRLARLTGAPVLPIFTWRSAAGRHVVDIGPPVDLPRTGDAGADLLAGTRRCASIVEAAVRAHPAQWLWIHRRWKRPPAAAIEALSRDGVADVRANHRGSCSSSSRASD